MNRGIHTAYTQLSREGVFVSQVGQGVNQKLPLVGDMIANIPIYQASLTVEEAQFRFDSSQ